MDITCENLQKSELGFESREARFFPLESLNLSEKQLSKIKNSTLRQLGLFKKTKLSDYDDDKRYNELYEINFKEVRNREFSKLDLLFEIYSTQLERIRNNFHTTTYELNTLRWYWFKRLNQQLSKHDLLKAVKSKGSDFYDELRDLYKKVTFIENNKEWAESYFELFNEKKQVIYLQTAVNLLQSANSSYILLSCESNFMTSLNYKSRNRFCAYSNEIKSINNELELVNALKLYDKQGLTHSFLTLSPNNISNLTKDDFNNLCLVLKEFWRDKRISKVFKGYYGVPEMKHKGHHIFNVHFHFICLRSKNIMQGYIDKMLVRDIFKEKCNKFGNDKVKGSFIIDIRAPHINNPDKQLGAVRYIHQYITKGIDVDTCSARRIVIESTNGVRMLRAGGLLKQNSLKELTINNNVYESIENFNLPCNIIAGGNEQLSGVKIPYKTIESYKLQGLGPLAITERLLYKKVSFSGCSLRVKTDLFYELKKSMFSKKPILCKFSNKKLHFKGTKRNKFTSHIGQELFIIDSLEGLGVSKPLLEKYSEKFGFPAMDKFSLISSNSVTDYDDYCKFNLI